MSIIAKRRGKDTTSTNNEAASSAKTFLGKEEAEAYIDCKTLLDFIDHGRLEDVEELERFFDLVHQGRKFTISKRVRTDAGGRKYTYQNFHSSKGPEGVKVCLIGNIQQFISDYHAGTVTINFNFEQLIAEAEDNN